MKAVPPGLSAAGVLNQSLKMAAGSVYLPVPGDS